ncbi:hypothetical protein, partial [Ferruginibacter sp.]
GYYGFECSGGSFAAGFFLQYNLRLFLLFCYGHLFFMASSLRRTLIRHIIVQLLSKRILRSKK